MPDKLKPILTEINNFRYFLAEGGRGGGKSQAVGRYLLYLAETRNVRIVCGREIQKSITESVYSLMVDLIRANNLDFKILSTRIEHRTSGSVINFRGFREQGSFNIQGMEGVDITWIDEAQALTKQTLDVLIPTIRKNNAKIFFTMNRHVERDPAFETFAHRDDCLHMHINYVDNQFCTDALRREAEECRKKSEEDYQHIWMGKPLLKTEDSVFSESELRDTNINKHELAQGYGLRIAGFDIARYGDDKCACVVIQQMGALHWEVVFVDEWGHKDLNYTTGRILMISNEQHAEKSIIDEDGLGSGPLDTLNKGRGMDNFLGFRNPPISYKDDKEYANVRTKNTYKLRDMVRDGKIAIPDEDLIRELCTIKYEFDNYQRKRLISKDVMKNKFRVKSPNKADALIMAVSLIGEFLYKQEEPYRPKRPQYSDGNLFEIAGIR